MARAQGIETAQKTYAGMGLSNALVALAGALFAQTNGFADSTMGIGTIMEARHCLVIACGESKAVAVQAMIEADVAGILFTANPVSGNRDEARKSQGASGRWFGNR